jgi:hypothetical protein
MLVDHKNVDDLAYRKDFQTEAQFNARVTYFNWASHMLSQGSFKSMRDQMIWEYHSEGLSRRKIAERVDLNDRWCGRKILQIREYLMSMSSQSAAYG